MSNDKGLVSRIPFEEIGTVSSWDMPSLDHAGNVIPSVKRQQKDPRKDEVVEDVSEEELGPVTAEQLAKVTEEAEKQAREEGYAKGYEQGIKQGEKKGLKLGEQKAYRETKATLEEKQGTFEALANTLFQPATRHDALLENAILDIAKNLAQHLLNSELDQNPAKIFTVVAQAVESLPAGADKVRVLINPQDLATVEEAFVAKSGEWQFIADPSLARGGCKVESATSAVDYSVEHRLSEWLLAAEQEQAEPVEALEDFKEQHEMMQSKQLEQGARAEQVSVEETNMEGSERLGNMDLSVESDASISTVIEEQVNDEMPEPAKENIDEGAHFEGGASLESGDIGEIQKQAQSSDKPKEITKPIHVSENVQVPKPIPPKLYPKHDDAE